MIALAGRTLFHQYCAARGFWYDSLFYALYGSMVLIPGEVARVPAVKPASTLSVVEECLLYPGRRDPNGSCDGDRSPMERAEA